MNRKEMSLRCQAQLKTIHEELSRQSALLATIAILTTIDPRIAGAAQEAEVLIDSARQRLNRVAK